MEKGKKKKDRGEKDRKERRGEKKQHKIATGKMER